MVVDEQPHSDISAFRQLQKGSDQRKEALLWNCNTSDERGGSLALHHPNFIDSQLSAYPTYC